MSGGWTIVQERFDPRTARAYEGLFTLGSGYLHIRGSLEQPLADAPQNAEYMRLPANVTAEEFRPVKSKWGTYVPGLFGRHPLLGNEMINLPWPLGVELSLDGTRLDVESAAAEHFRRELNLRDATLLQQSRWRSGRKVAAARFERFISAARPHLCLQRVTIELDRPCELAIEAFVDADIRTNGFDHLHELRLSPVAENAFTCELRTDGGDRVSIATELTLSGAAGAWSFSEHARRGSMRLALSIPAPATIVLEKRTAISTNRDVEPTAPRDALAAARALTWQQLHAEHAAGWQRRWDTCDIQIDGDAASQLALRTALFHLLRCHVPDGRVAIDAKGYAGDAYWGRFFWDTEIFLLPFFLYTDPPRARSLVDFRIQSLDGARRNARRYGYPGARYAWESDAAGDENCPNWQYADHEVHVTADVVYALAHYAAATGDEAFLAGPAAQVALETGRYWLARVDRRPGEDHYSLLGVMGPDEYTPITHNNAFTNRMAAFALGTAAQIGASAGAAPEELARFREVSQRLPVPRGDGGRLVMQCEDFERLAEPRFDELWRDRGRPFAANVSQERLYRSRCIKQADVLMLMMLFRGEFSRDEIERAWEYYLPLTTHDSSLSPGVHAIIATWLGRHEEAWRFWQQAAGIDLDVEQGGAAEGIHIANAAALWQVVVFGFLGMRSALQSDELMLEPVLPAAWESLSLPLVWKGCPLRLVITREQMVVENLGDAAVHVGVRGDRRDVPPRGRQSWPA